MATDLTLAIIALSVCLWIIVIHSQTPIELLLMFQKAQSTASKNGSTMTMPDNDNAYMNLIQESPLVPIKCKVTKAIKRKSTDEGNNAIGTINFSQFPNGVIQASGEIMNDVELFDFDFEIEALAGNKIVVIKNNELFIKREYETIYFIFNTKLFSINNECNLNKKRMRKNVIGRNFVVYFKGSDE